MHGCLGKAGKFTSGMKTISGRLCPAIWCLRALGIETGRYFFVPTPHFISFSLQLNSLMMSGLSSA